MTSASTSAPPRPRPPEPRRRVGLVLGAGGPVGHAFHAGVLAALADAGWDARQADLVIGTSIGSATAVLLRAGMPPADMVARLTGEPLSPPCEALVARAGGWPSLVADLTGDHAVWGSLSVARSPRLLRSLARHPRRFRPGIFLASMTRPGRAPVETIVDVVDRLLDHRWPERDLWICAIDAATGERVVFGRPGSPPVDIGLAVAASGAVPALFGPVQAGGRGYLDGGLHSPINSDLAVEGCAGFDGVVMSVPMGIDGPPGRAGKDLPGRWINHWVAEHGVAPLRRDGVPVITFEPGRSELELMHYDAFDLSHRPEIAKRAYQAARRRLMFDAAECLDHLAPPKT